MINKSHSYPFKVKTKKPPQKAVAKKSNLIIGLYIINSDYFQSPSLEY